MLEAWVAAQWIGNIVPTRPMHPVEVEALQVFAPAGLTPRQDWLSLQEGIWPIINDQIELLTRQKVAPEDAQCFYSSQQLLLSDDKVALRRNHFSGVAPKRASLLKQHST